MNGYFNNLALRSMNAGNLVEPRLPSLFEPPRGESEAAAPVYSAESRPGPVDTPAIERPRARISIEQPSVAEDVAGPQSAVATARPTPSSAEPTAMTDERSTHKDHTAPTITVAEQPAVAEPPTMPAETVSTNQTQTETPIEPEFAIKSVHAVAQQPDKIESPFAFTRVTPQTFSVPQSTIATETNSTVEEHVSIVEKQEVFFEPPPTLKPPTVFKTEVQPQRVERVSEKSRNTERTDFRSVTRSITNYAWRESDPVEPQPSINITIGRVEVRAAPATNTKPTRTRQESPVMPLDEYLRKQRRGER